MRRGWISGAVVLLLWAAQATAHAMTDDALSLEDVRRPIYRGNIRYNSSISNYLYKSLSGEEDKKSKYYSGLKIKDVGRNNGLTYNELKNITSDNEEVTVTQFSKSIFGRDETNDELNDKSWSLVKLVTDENDTKIVENFIENSLLDLGKKSESLDKLIMSHTEPPSDKIIQIYPEGSPPSWSNSPPRPNVIVVEDVHPSKLPKPDYSPVTIQIQNSKPSPNYGTIISTTVISGSYGGQSKPKPPQIPSNNYEPVYQQISTRPPFHYELTTKPSNYYPPMRPPSSQKPSHYYEISTKPPTTTSEPIPSHYYETNAWPPIPKPPSVSELTTKPPPSKPPHYYKPSSKPEISKPSHYYEPSNKPEISKPSNYYKPTNKPIISKPSQYYEQTTVPLVKPPQYYKPTTSAKPSVTKPSHYYEPVPVITTKPPVQYDFPKPIVPKPVYQNPPPTQPTQKPMKPIKPTYVFPKPVTVKPAYEHETEPWADRKPIQVSTTYLPKPILVEEVTPSYSKPPPEPPPSRPPPPAILVLESPIDNHVDCGTVQVINSASWKDCPDVTVLLNAAQPQTHAVPVASGAPQAIGGPSTGLVPLPPVPPLVQPPFGTTPATEDEDEEEYDDDVVPLQSPSTAATPTTSTSSSRPSIFSFLFNALPLMGPISVSLWIIFLGPLSFILIGLLGVVSFLFPWVAPPLLFGRFG